MSLRDTIFNDSHHTTYGGHFGMTHTHSKIQLHYFWPGMSDFVRDRITACHKCIARKSPVHRHQPMGHVPVSGRFERVAMDLLDVSVISAKGHKYILVVCDYFTKYTEAYPLKDKTAHSVADALMDIWLPRYGFPMFLHSDQGKEFDNTMIHKLPFMMLACNTTVHTTTGFTPYRLVFGEECNLPGNLVHRELRPDPPPGDAGTYASWVRQALYEAYDEVRAQQQRATHRQKRNYDSKAVVRIPNWKLGSEVLSTSTEKQTVFSMDWTLQNCARTNGMGRRNSGRRRCANILRPHGRSQTLRNPRSRA